jgi:mannosyltransferase OCH1-like enzyme
MYYRPLLMHVLLLITAGSCVAYQQQDLLSDWQWADFDVSLPSVAVRKLKAKTEDVMGMPLETLHTFFKELYESHHNSPCVLAQEPRIPKIIHHIWLGSPVPEELKGCIESWRKNHPGWRYKLWTDKEVKQLTLYNQELYDATTNYGQKADLLRLELLYNVGGVYADTDTECLQRVDVLHYLFDFYIGIQPLDAHFLQLGTGIIGSVPHHPLLKEVIMSIKKHAAHIKGIPAKTGPVHFTKIFFEHAGRYGFSDIALPPQYFYPLGAYETIIDRASWRQQGAFTVHHWAKTWMPEGYRRLPFRSIKNQDSTKEWNAH